MDTATVAAICGVSRETARRWRRQGRMPEPARRLLSIADNLGEIAPEWDGWRFHDGFLVSPTGFRATPGEVAAIWYWRQLAAELRRDRAASKVRALVPQTLRL